MAEKVQVDDLVGQLLAWTKPGMDEHEERIRRFDRAYDVYRPGRRSQQMPVRGTARIRVPFALANLDTALVNMVQDPPRCLVLPRRPEYADKAKKFQLAMDYYVERDHLVEKQTPISQQALIYGMTVGKTHWLLEEREKTHKRVVVDPVTNMAISDPATGRPASVVGAEKVVIYDGPSFEPWDVYDAWWDPAARSPDDASYFCLRSYLTVGQLIQQACTVKGKHSPEDCNGIYHNVDRLIDTGPAQRRTATAQQMRLNKQRGAQHDVYVVVEVWRDDRLTAYGNDAIELRDGPNPHWHGRKPIVASSTRPDVLEMQGIPETELIDHIQQALWTNQELRFENLLLTVQRMFTYRENAFPDARKIKIGPRSLIGTQDHDDLRAVDVPPLPPEVYREEAELLGRMQLITGISPFVSGADMQTIDQSTATGISVLSEVAGRLLKFKSAQVHFKIWQRVFEQWGNDVQQFMSDDLWVRIVGPDGATEFERLTPDDVVGDFDFINKAGGEASSKAQRKTEMIQLAQTLAPFAQAGLVSLPVLLREVAEAFEFPNPEALVAAVQPQQAAAPYTPGQGMPNGQLAPGAPDQAQLQSMLPPGVMQGQQ